MLERGSNSIGVNFAEVSDALGRVVATINRRYATLNCIDLDYNTFKSYCFQSRTHQEELRKDLTQRNTIPFKTINNYTKKFKKYKSKVAKHKEEAPESTRTFSLPPSRLSSNQPYRNTLSQREKPSKSYKPKGGLASIKKTISQTIEENQDLEQMME